MFVALDIQFFLEDEGWDVAGPFATTLETLTYLQDNRPTCAILDVRLADGDVFPVAEKLQAEGVPFVFHSGHADSLQLQERFPAAAFCAKPCLPSVLSDVLNCIVSKRAIRGATRQHNASEAKR